jgi:hypothetical protein
MIHFFHSPFVFWTKVPNHNQLKEYLLPKIEKDYRLNGKSYRDESCWECNSTSSFHSPVDVDKSILAYEPLIDAIWNSYSEFIDELIDSQMLCTEAEIGNYSESSLSNLWYNYYNKGEFQETHDHSNKNDFSGIYLLSIPEEYNTTAWYNYNAAITPFENGLYFGQKDAQEHGIGEGHMLIFPSKLLHHVPPASGTRITISYNFRSPNA